MRIYFAIAATLFVSLIAASSGTWALGNHPVGYLCIGVGIDC